MESGDKHPDEGLFGYISCPICSSHLHGHGWRKRHLETAPGAFNQVWIHRKRCPKCGRTFTLIPEGMAAIAQYPLERIREALAYRSSHGHCTKSLRIPLPTQKRWWKRFTTRVMAEHGMFPTEEENSDSISNITPLSTLPLGWILAKDSAELRAMGPCSGPPHHIMVLPPPPAPW